MKRLLFTSLIIVATTSWAQDAHFSQYHNNMVYLNPAYAGSLINPTFSLSYRSQWPDLEGNYKTGLFSFHQYVPKVHGGIGAYYMLDRAGQTLTTNSFNLIYAPRFDVNEKVVIQPAITGGYMLKHLNLDNLTFGDIVDPRYGFVLSQPTSSNSTGSSLNKTFFDLGAGVLCFTKSFYAGYSLAHITAPNEAFIENATSALPRKHTFDIGAIIGGEEPGAAVMNPDFIYLRQGSFEEWKIGMTWKYNIFLAGMAYRKSDAFILLVGIQASNMQFSYSYDVTTSELRSVAGGSHEVCVSYKITGRPKNVTKMPLGAVAF